MTKRFSTVIIFLGLGMARLSRSENLVRPWESSGLWAPAAGLSYAYTAVAEEPETIFSNIAGLTQLTAPSFRYSHRPYNLEPNYDSFAYAQPFGERGNVFGLGLNGARYGYGAAYTEAVAGSAFGMGKGVSGGLGLRVSTKGLPSEGASQAFAADVGLLWKDPVRPLRLGAAALRLPLNTTTPVGPHLFALGASWALETLRLSLDSKFSAGSASLHAGLELPVRDLLDLRLGLSTLGYKGAAFGPSAGLGLHYGDLSLDYAATPTASQGVLHSLSVGYRFNDGLDGFVDEDVRELRQRRAQEKALRSEHERFARRQSTAPAHGDQGAFQVLWTVSGRKVSLQWLPPLDAPGKLGTSGMAGVSGAANTANTTSTANIAGIPSVSGTTGTSGVASAPLRYTITQGLLPTAKFRALNETPQTQSSWEGEVSLQGVTYYFRVLSVRADGSAGPSSAVTAVVIP